MEKATFIASAKLYYALAVLHFCKLHEPAGSRAIPPDERELFEFQPSQVAHFFNSGDYNAQNLAGNPHLLREAIDWLVAEESITCLKDEFGPDILQLDEDVDTVVGRYVDDGFTVFIKYWRLANPSIWLHQALLGVRKKYEELGVEDSDFNTQNPEWEPLPIQRENPATQTLISTIDRTIEEVRSENGYSANYPIEQSFVLRGLRTFVSSLKEDTATSLAAVRQYAVAPLRALRNRFTDTVLGLVVTAAVEALTGWLSQFGQIGMAIIRGLFSG